MNSPEKDPRIAKMRKLVISLVWFCALTIAGSTVFGLYTCVTERPAREIFFESDGDPVPG